MLRPANPHIICVAYCHIMRFAIYVTVSDVLVTTSIDLCVYRARFRCPGSPFRLFLSNRDRNTLEKSPIRPYRTISAIIHRRNSGLLDLHTLSAHGMVCPGSQKEAKITNRDNEIWPGSHVNRLPSPPGHRLRIDKMLQCLTGMRPYRDSNVSLEVEESSSTPNRKHGGNPAMLRITAPRAWCGITAYRNFCGALDWFSLSVGGVGVSRGGVEFVPVDAGPVCGRDAVVRFGRRCLFALPQGVGDE